MAKLKKRQDGRYIKSVYIGMKETSEIGENGKPILKKHYETVYGRTIKEVEENATRLKILLGKGIDISTANDRFGVWAERYVNDKKTEGLSHSHISNIENFANKHLEPIHHIPISKVEIQHIKNIVINMANDVLDADGNLIRKAFSKRTITGVLDCTRNIFDLAIESRAIDYNPAKYVKVPKNTVQTSRNAITEEQQKWIEEFNHNAQCAAMIMLHAGLRRGEVTALKWNNIDLDEKQIVVEASVEYISNQAIIKGTKSKSIRNSSLEDGVRVVDIDNVLVNYLKTYKMKSNHTYVVHTKNGNMMTKSAWKRMWDSYMKDLNVQYGYTRNNKILLGLNPDKPVSKNRPGGLPIVIDVFDMHQLRHTFATNCYLSDVPVELCKEWMGHKDIKTTLDIYTHLDRKYKRKKLNLLNEFQEWKKQKEQQLEMQGGE